MIKTKNTSKCNVLFSHESKYRSAEQNQIQYSVLHVVVVVLVKLYSLKPLICVCLISIIRWFLGYIFFVLFPIAPTYYHKSRGPSKITTFLYLMKEETI